MALYEFEGKRPAIGEETYVCETADVIGDVTIGPNCYIGPGARIKGDYGKVTVGGFSSVQENCVIHARPDEICAVGERCTIGHGSILHNCTVGDGASVGMGAIVSDWAVVGESAIVGEGCVVKQHQEIPAGKVALGVPAIVVGDVSGGRTAERAGYSGVYPELAKRYAKSLKRIE